MKFPAIVLVLLIGSGFTSCSYMGGKRVNGNGQTAFKEYNLGSFSGVAASGSIEIIVTTASSHALKIETDENLLQYLEVENDNGLVEVHTKEGYSLHPKSKIKVYASAPTFDKLEVSGSGKITSTSKIIANNKLHTEVSGSGDIKLDVDAPAIETEISGSGSATISGNTKDFSASVSGSGDIRCFNLLTENTEIDIAGSGDAEVYASKTLDVDIAGGGDVKYKGGATVKQSVAGSGKISKVD
jgi:hypothetical protein